MQPLDSPLSPHAWMFALFSSKAAREGAVVRRKVRDVDRLCGREAFVEEVRRRGFGLIENAGQYVIFCNAEPLRRIL